ncbi:hypothetical protein Q21_gp42 [Vibrio phage VPp1]|nr:hypothetical protein Q21_gp42 [Vibrio phage VPp1]
MVELLSLFILAVVIIVAALIFLEKGMLETAVSIVMAGLMFYLALAIYIVSPMFEALGK